MIVIVDTDILSMFAKAQALEVLMELVGPEQLRITPAIADEISIPLQYGYHFPKQILSLIPVVDLSPPVVREVMRLKIAALSLGRGEREAIAYCQMETAIFITNDVAAQQFAQKQGVAVISFQGLLRSLWVGGIRTLVEVRELLEQIKQADRLTISTEVEDEIFSQPM